MFSILCILLHKPASLFEGHQKEIKYVANFDPVLRDIITETRYLEQLGFHVPELARNVALQASGYWTGCSQSAQCTGASTVNTMSQRFLYASQA